MPGLGSFIRYTPQGFLLGGIRNLIQGQPFMAGAFGVPYNQANWGQSGSASNPDAGMSAFGSSTSPNVFTPNAQPSAPATPVGGASPFAGAAGAPTTYDPSLQGVPGGGPSGGPLALPFQPGADSIWGNAAAPGTTAAPQPSPLAATAAANPGAGPRATDWGPAPTVATLGGHAQ